MTEKITGDWEPTAYLRWKRRRGKAVELEQLWRRKTWKPIYPESLAVEIIEEEEEWREVE